MRKPSTPIRHAMIWAALAAALLLPATPGRGETQTYLIQLSDLVNLPNDCGGGSRYNTCVATAQPGFRLTDVLPAGSVVTTAVLELNHGVQCADSAYTFQATWNGTAIGSFTSPRWCNCNPRRQIVTLEIPPASYTPRGANVFSITNPSNCQGLAPHSDLGSAYARVTVEYEVPGGGGGDCDLTPVLQRIDALDAEIAAAGYATAALVSAEHAATRAWVTGENDTTRAEIAAAEAREGETLLRLMVEGELAASEGAGQDMTAASCLPEEDGGRIGLTASVVLDTIEAYRLADCNVSAADQDLERGHAALAAGDFSRACDWYVRAYHAAGQACP